MKSPIPYIVDWKLKIGDDFSKVITFPNSTITDWTFAGNAVASDNSTTTALTFTKTSATSVTVSIADATTADFTAQPYKVNVTITIATVKITYIEGFINVRL